MSLTKVIFYRASVEKNNEIKVESINKLKNLDYNLEKVLNEYVLTHQRKELYENELKITNKKKVTLLGKGAFGSVTQNNNFVKKKIIIDKNVNTTIQIKEIINEISLSLLFNNYLGDDIDKRFLYFGYSCGHYTPKNKQDKEDAEKIYLIFPISDGFRSLDKVLKKYDTVVNKDAIVKSFIYLMVRHFQNYLERDKKYIHYVHSDINDKNILISDEKQSYGKSTFYEMRLIDFGMSKNIPHKVNSINSIINGSIVNNPFMIFLNIKDRKIWEGVWDEKCNISYIIKNKPLIILFLCIIYYPKSLMDITQSENFYENSLDNDTYNVLVDLYNAVVSNKIEDCSNAYTLYYFLEIYGWLSTLIRVIIFYNDKNIYSKYEFMINHTIERLRNYLANIKINRNNGKYSIFIEKKSTSEIYFTMKSIAKSYNTFKENGIYNNASPATYFTDGNINKYKHNDLLDNGCIKKVSNIDNIIKAFFNYIKSTKNPFYSYINSKIRKNRKASSLSCIIDYIIKDNNGDTFCKNGLLNITNYFFILSMQRRKNGLSKKAETAIKLIDILNSENSACRDMKYIFFGSKNKRINYNDLLSKYPNENFSSKNKMNRYNQWNKIEKKANENIPQILEDIIKGIEEYGSVEDI